MLEEWIALDMQASNDMLTLVRLAVGAVGARAGFDVEAVEDLQLAADELCASVIRRSRSHHQRIRLVCRWDDGSVHVECDAVGEKGAESVVAATDGIPDDIDVLAGDLSERILDALVDEHGTTGEGRSAWLRKRAGATA